MQNDSFLKPFCWRQQKKNLFLNLLVCFFCFLPVLDLLGLFDPGQLIYSFVGFFFFFFLICLIWFWLLELSWCDSLWELTLSRFFLLFFQHYTLHSLTGTVIQKEWQRDVCLTEAVFAGTFAHRGERGRRRKSVQSRTYLSASIQFVQRQSNSKCKQRIFECDGRITKSLPDGLKLKDHAIKKR